MYHQFFFTVNRLGRQPITLQHSQPLSLQTLALVATAILCVLCEYASGMKDTEMLTQEEYRGTFCPSPVICFTLEAAVPINYKYLGRVTPPLWSDYTKLDAPQFPLVLLSLD